MENMRRTFITDDFLLRSDTAKKLYGYAKKMPIIDYHCHLSPKEICEDKHFENITDLWLRGDHYKWRLMRAYGVDEKYITGDGSDYEKFSSWMKTLSLAIGSPLYEWSHMEMKQYFGFDGVLDENSIDEVWNLANEKLKTVSARELIRSGNVEVICTTDDPIDDLQYHRAMAEEDMGFRVYPAWRPDRILNTEKADWADYVHALENASGMQAGSYEGLKAVLKNRMEFFIVNGCRISDHGLAHVPYMPLTYEETDEIFRKRRSGGTLTEKEAEGFRSTLLLDLFREYARLGWAAQLHYGVKRDNSTYLLNRIGNDAGGDNIGDRASISSLCGFLDALDREGSLPKTVIYSLDPNDNTAIDTVAASFQRGPVTDRIQHGAAWWFNDNYDGMRDQLRSLAAQGYLAGFIGMLTDSRSFISYTRHDYFRRVLCGFIAELVDAGRYPDDEEKLKKITEDICCNNAKRYFGF